MNIEFLSAKNGEITARFNSLYLHSAYSPDNEAKRFIDNLKIPFTPECIICCEPGISYILSYLKQKFPDIKFGVIRYSTDFNKYNTNFDYIFNGTSTDFSNEIFDKLGEETICSTYFLSWTPSAKAFYEIDSKVWKEIKEFSEKAKTILVTRQYFEKRWFLNCCYNLTNLKNQYKLNKIIDKPILIVASGPSLKNKLEVIKKYKDRFFIICLSSAISCLLDNNIIPDLCFSTDGGYWAGQHLKKLQSLKLPLAITSEAYCNSKILKSNPVILFKYSDGLSSDLIKSINIDLPLANRNGTVSGTALDFALLNSSSSIYFAGLDLASSKGFQHTQPNELELNSNIKDMKINSKEKRITPSTFTSNTLEVYKQWFQNKNLGTRKVFRIIEIEEKQNTLGQIQDISLEDFENKAKTIHSNSANFNSYFIKSEFLLNPQLLKSEIINLINNKDSIRQLFPLDYVSIGRNNENATLIEKRIQNQLNQLREKIEKQFQ